MRPCTAEEIARCVGGKVVFGSPLAVARGVAIDSRKVQEEDLFCAIKGERADGHDFLPEVLDKGASVALLERQVELEDRWLGKAQEKGFAMVLVDSTIRALGQLAKDLYGQLHLSTIGITGSLGKTSTKDLMHSILSQKFKVYKNPGNLNSHIGLPLAVLGIDEDYEYSILEMAMRKRGEIQELCQIAKPRIGVLTDISASHIGVLGSLEEIAKAKAELLESLPGDGLAMLFGDNPWIRKISSSCRCQKFYYGFKDDLDIRAHDVLGHDDGSTEFSVSLFGKTYRFSLPVPGVHQIENALAGIGIGFHLGLDGETIQEGLSNVRLSPMRQEVLRYGDMVIINDAYNASEKSMKAALDLLSTIGKGRKVAILGDMLEMGDYGPKAHSEVGAYARMKADVLCAVGPLGFYIKEGWVGGTSESPSSSWFSDKEKALSYIESMVEPGDTILVKASRGMGFETIVQALSQIAKAKGVEK